MGWQVLSSSFWDGVGSQLRCPTGNRGRMTGALMGLANAKPNALAVAALGLADGDHVLELGCGPGYALEAILRSTPLARATGFDWSEVMLAQASTRNRAALEDGRLALVRGDFSTLPVMDGSADRILAVNVVYFMDHPVAIREAYRVLRPGGRIVVYATDQSVMRRWRFAGPHTHRLYDQELLKALLADAGFTSGNIDIAAVDAGFRIRGLLAVAKKIAG